MTYTFTINKNDYMMLNMFKKQELDKMIELIFKTGYETIFPSKQSNDPLVGKITNLENTLERLIGIGNGSSKKGELAEYILGNIIQSRYGDITYTDTSHIPHTGDAHIKFDSNNTNIMLESKNYTTKVNKDEIDKMKSDMVTSNIKWGIFLSWNSNIIEKKEFDVEFFHVKGYIYHIIYISNLSNDIDRLDLAIQLIRKLIVINCDKGIGWIQHIIMNDLEQLNTIISKNYQMRVWYEEMNNTIVTSSSKFHNRMRDYMYEMDQMVKTIIDRITNTTSQALNISHDSYNAYLEKYKDNKKLFPILSILLDIFKEHNIILDEENIKYNDTNIGIVKVMGKKITIYWDKYKHTSELGFDSNTDSFNMIKLFASSVKNL